MAEDADQQIDLKDDGSNGAAIVEPVVGNGVAEQAGFGGWLQGGPQGNGQRQKVDDQSPAQPVLRLFSRDRDEAAADTGTQGEENHRVGNHHQGCQGVVEDCILRDLCHDWGGCQNVIGYVDNQQKGRQAPAQSKPRVAFPQGTVAQIEEGGSQQGQQVLEGEEFKAKGDQHHAPDDLTDGGLPGGIVVHLRSRGRELGHLVHQLEVKFIRLHVASPPNKVCRRLRMR